MPSSLLGLSSAGLEGCTGRPPSKAVGRIGQPRASSRREDGVDERELWVYALHLSHRILRRTSRDCSRPANRLLRGPHIRWATGVSIPPFSEMTTTHLIGGCHGGLARPVRLEA